MDFGTLLLIVAAALTVTYAVMYSKKSAQLKALQASHQVVSDNHDRYLSVVKILDDAINGRIPKTNISSVLGRGASDYNTAEMDNAVSLNAALNIIRVNAQKAAVDCGYGSVASQASMVRRFVAEAGASATRVSNYLAFNAGNLLDQINAYEKTGNISAVKQLIAANLDVLSEMLEPFQETLDMMVAVGVSREEAGIVKGSPMAIILDVAAKVKAAQA